MDKLYKPKPAKKHSFLLIFFLIASPLQAMEDESEKEIIKNNFVFMILKQAKTIKDLPLP